MIRRLMLNNEITVRISKTIYDANRIITIVIDWCIELTDQRTSKHIAVYGPLHAELTKNRL